MTDSLFLESEFLQFRVAYHEVAHDNGHLHDKLPILVFLLAGLGLFRNVNVYTLLCHAVLAGPLHRLLEFLLVIDSFCHAADDLGKVDRLIAHAQIFLEEIGVDD